SYAWGEGSWPAWRRRRYSSKAISCTRSGSRKNSGKRRRYSANGRGRPVSQPCSCSTRINSLRTLSRSGGSGPGRKSSMSAWPPLTLPSPPRGEGEKLLPSPLGGEGRVRGSWARASSKAATKSSSVREGGSGGDGFIVGFPIEEVAQPGPDFLKVPLDGPLGAACLLGDLGHLVSLDAQLEHQPLRCRQLFEGLGDGHLQDAVA